MWPDAWTRPVYCQNDFANIRKIDVIEVDGDFDLLEPSLQSSCRDIAAHALIIVRDGVITGEGPTTKGRVHFSRALDADDTAWCPRILTAAAVEHQPVSRAEVEALFQISDAATERTDDGRFDALLAKAIAHHAASASTVFSMERRITMTD
jgi:hypothetical protein